MEQKGKTGKAMILKELKTRAAGTTIRARTMLSTLGHMLP